jgi:predicted ATPase
MSTLLEKATITGFKALKATAEIPFSKLTVFAGANSVGKSSVIQSLLLGRITMENKSRPKTISLNGQYLLALGAARDVANNGKSRFIFEFENGEILDLNYKAPIKGGFFEVSENSVFNENNPFTTPNFHYLNAERIGPRPLYDNTVLAELANTGNQGEFSVQLLASGNERETAVVRNFHSVTQEEGESNDNLDNQATKWLNFVIPELSISANDLDEINRSTAKFNSHTPPNVGFGISYVLPIIIAGLIAEEGSLFIVENPEAHLHPSGQSRIGQFLAMVAASGVQVVVETHSEHVVNGMRLAAAKKIISNKSIVVNFMSRIEGKVKIKPIYVTDFLDFSDFPKGFLDQSIQDLMTLVQMRQKR